MIQAKGLLTRTLLSHEYPHQGANIPVYRDSNLCSTTVEARANISYRRIGG
jgi:hypothetical protein